LCILQCVVGEEYDSDNDNDEEVRCELTQLTEKLRENEMTCDSVTSRLQTADAAVRNGTKRVCIS